MVGSTSNASLMVFVAIGCKSCVLGCLTGFRIGM